MKLPAINILYCTSLAVVWAVVFILAADGYACNDSVCRLPNCRCASNAAPGGLTRSQLPQFVLFTYDDGMDSSFYDLMWRIFNGTRNDSMGCYLRSAFYMTNDLTNYTMLQHLAARGHEIGVHSFTHTTSASVSYNEWVKQTSLSRNFTAYLTNLTLSQVTGWRTPFLAYNSNSFKALCDYKFEYDTSIVDYIQSYATTDKYNFTWPFTLDYGSPIDCGGATLCPQPCPGMWEIPMPVLYTGSSMTTSSGFTMDPTGTASSVTQLYKDNFLLRYNGNRSPFGVFIHGFYLSGDTTRVQALIDFFNYVAALPDVFFVTPQQLLKWMRNPVDKVATRNLPYLQCPSTVPTSATPEICDGIDNNLNGQIDEGVLNKCSYTQGTFYTCLPCPAAWPNINSANPPVRENAAPAPTTAPTTAPTVAPTAVPTRGPTIAPTAAPTVAPTRVPTPVPTPAPTAAPTRGPTITPTPIPTPAATPTPTLAPTVAPTSAPTVAPSVPPTAPTSAPTVTPTSASTPAPTEASTVAPTVAPTRAPTPAPTPSPTPTSTPSPTPEPKVTCTIRVVSLNYEQTTATDSAKSRFITQFERDMSTFLKIPLDQVNVIELKPGSIIVVFTIPASALEALKRLVENSQSELRVHPAYSSTDPAYPVVAQGDESDESDNSSGGGLSTTTLLLYIVPGSVCALLLLLLIERLRKRLRQEETASSSLSSKLTNTTSGEDIELPSTSSSSAIRQHRINLTGVAVDK